MNEVKALPPPENYIPTPPTEPQPKPQPHQITEDLVNLKDDAVSADEQGNKLALALFNGPPTTCTNNSWEAFPSNGDSEVTSAWQTPAAESGKADWELALVESTSNLSKQKATLGVIADMERKQHLLVQEQQIWQQYGRDGMQGQVGLANISGASGYYGPSPQPMMMPYGMPQLSGMGQPGGYYYTQY
ncbi:hypothetical protein GH714_015556 [Hevea brasiliensis]|uniref:Uncharacterized protein n=1 Tax=Hevea brasiliensis TaxID=3981 RepID=A0A6A6MDR4_HEVBR|nr:hypothetical protein GH714_015556 [Hevea brasiliensis]